MELKNLTAVDFRAMMIAGSKRLSENVELINSLNVFPVPDGDTGTNMNMTFLSGIERLKQESTNHVGQASEALAKGLLMGARGNSGVILSQIFRGFSQSCKDKESLNAQDFVDAFVGGVEAAYKAIMKPVEGTILTVAREAAVRGEKKLERTDNIIEIMESIVRGASKALDQTPELLPVLKQVGVVDSGGKGLLCIYEGMLASLKGEDTVEENDDKGEKDIQIKHSHSMFDDIVENPLSMDDITYGYCTEIMVRIGEGPTVQKDFDYDSFRELLNTKGDSLLVVNDEELVKVHIHTENPGEIMQLGQEFGELIKIKVDNMREQVRALEADEQALQNQQNNASQEASSIPQVKQPYAIIAVAAGEGVADLFRSIGITEVLEGGQTMNPSTEDFVKAIEKVNAEKIILLPNNKNIIMAAEQTIQLSDTPIAVVPTKTIPEGIAAMMAFNADLSLEENKEAMTANLDSVVSGQITYAIRDTEINQLHIKKDEFMGIVAGDIILSNPVLEDALVATLEEMMEDDSEIITIIVGEDGDMESAEKVAEELMANNDDIEVEVIEGNQPVYHYILSAE
ncbi:DAK2 domain-containing protein [Fundicoccus culcitae]|uniref:DAK2 domain-containing protein n=1 Tax=Fundicoccus culcitae TaxID=2969821 RepID=A0ABY5P655_9LACT|nr:DAK2 domain-containing protein [Fundicoccus culcitae]UUX34090.1 DAK2 domain-containing protein [Fundicoccus culcitae]